MTGLPETTLMTRLLRLRADSILAMHRSHLLDFQVALSPPNLEARMIAVPLSLHVFNPSSPLRRAL